MTITKKQPEDYDRILDAIFSDLDIANDSAGEKLVSSFKRLSEEHPSLLGLYWTLASHRSGWDALTFALKSLAESKVENYIIFNQVLPNLASHRFSGVMRGFYSSVNYVLENFHEASKDLEDGVDWVFDEIKGNKDTQSS